MAGRFFRHARVFYQARRGVLRNTTVTVTPHLKHLIQEPVPRSGRQSAERLPVLAMSILGMLGFGEKTKEEEEEDNEAKLIHNIKRGILAFQRGEYDKAETLLHIALKMAQDMANQDGVTYIFDQLANIAFVRGDLMKSERLFKDVIQRLVSLGTRQEDNKIIEMSLKLACIYSEWKQDPQAIVGFRHCIQTQEKKIRDGETDEDTMVLWGMSHDSFAQFLLERNHFKEAIEEYQAALSTCCGLYGEKADQCIVLVNSLGVVSSLMDNHSSAVSHFEKAVRLCKEIDCQDRATYIVNLGMAKIKMGLKQEALDNCNKAWRLAKKSENEEVIKEANECIKTANSI